MNELENRWRDLGEFIREQRRVGHLSLRKLSEMAGISNPYLSQIERGLRKPSAEILQQIARALEISSETLYVRAGILEAQDGETDLVAEIRRDPWINEEQKKTLIQIYTSFRRSDERRARSGRALGCGRRRGIPGRRGWLTVHRAPPRRPLPALLAARPARRGRQRRHERLRPRAGVVAGPGRRRLHASSSAAGRRPRPT